MKRNDTISMRLPTHLGSAYSFSLLIIIALFCMVLLFRFPEVINMFLQNPTDAIKMFVIIFALLSFFILPPRSMSLLIRRLGLVAIIVITIKNDMDHVLLYDASNVKGDFSDFIAIVTGASSGIGLATTKKLLDKNITVVMGCLYMEECMNAKALISNLTTEHKLIPMHLNLADLVSVKEFVHYFKASFHRLDFLINNAGLIAEPGTRTVQGYEMSIGVMHIGHFALTKWLTDLFMTPIKGEDRASRVVNIASQAYWAGDFHDSLFEDDGSFDFKGAITDNCGTTGPFGLIPCCPAASCPITNGYGRSKLANILHMQELQIRTDQMALQSEKPLRRLVTSSLHPGPVSTNIHPNFRRAALILRSPEQAANVVMHAIFSDKYLPGSYIDAMRGYHDLHNYREKYLSRHVAAYANISHLPFVRPPIVREYSFDEYIWKRRFAGENQYKVKLAERLWDVTDKIVTEWDNLAT